MKIIVTDEVSAEGLALLTQEPRIQLDVRLGLKKEELLAVIGNYDIIITRSGTTVDKALLDAATRLKQTLMFDLPMIGKDEVQALMKADVAGGGKRTSR